MKQQTNTLRIKIVLTGLLLSTLFVWVGCNNAIERSGYVLDNTTRLPLEGVSVDIDMKAQRKDSLAVPVFTNEKGYFHIQEKRGKDIQFLVYKEGYIGFTSALSVPNDTIYLEKEVQ